MKKKNIAIWISVFVCIALLMLYAVTASEKTSNTPEQPTEDLQPKQTASVDTSDWLTYENKEYGYRFKYPKGVEVVDGKDPRYSFYDYPRSTFIILPAKYPDLKAPDYKKPESFDNYTITIGWEEWYANESGKTTEAIIQSLVENPSRVLTEVITTDESTTAVYNNGALVYIFKKTDLYSMGLEGSNPNDQHIPGWLEDIDNAQLTEWVNHYPDYLRILKGIYSTFETF